VSRGQGPEPEEKASRFSRRRFVAYGLGSVAFVGAAGVAGLELVSHGVLPGQSLLDQFDGACTVPATRFGFEHPGPSVSGAFFSQARNTRVGYTIGYPPYHVPGEPIPLVVMLHGFGGNHTDALVGITPAQAVALDEVVAQARMAIVTIDGGNSYWNAHPMDDPIAMITDELIPMCQKLGLGRDRIGSMGISMGGYGALLLAEKHPQLIDAVAAISPAIWTSYAQARGVDKGAYASAGDFAADDVVKHAGALESVPVRVACGDNDPFRPGVAALLAALPATTVARFSAGCHTDSFFAEQEPPSLEFLATRLSS